MEVWLLYHQGTLLSLLDHVCTIYESKGAKPPEVIFLFYMIMCITSVVQQGSGLGGSGGTGGNLLSGTLNTPYLWRRFTDSHQIRGGGRVARRHRAVVGQGGGLGGSGRTGRNKYIIASIALWLAGANAGGAGVGASDIIIIRHSVSQCVCVTTLTHHISGVSYPIHTKFGVVAGWLGGHRAAVRQGGGPGSSGGTGTNMLSGTLV